MQAMLGYYQTNVMKVAKRLLPYKQLNWHSVLFYDNVASPHLIFH